MVAGLTIKLVNNKHSANPKTMGVEDMWSLLRDPLCYNRNRPENGGRYSDMFFCSGITEILNLIFSILI